ncbi:putative transmembrane protein [Gregarina niphandrodes]|uniref:Transmembrane protein n=1 Tax=Gregarina niphandrodes TaxID=110365 RepID=A0A023AYE4_GRENI|nr:putative transmembrane protein [Gregarina niphandrodes]EZG43692.1 putative transmembrane protein [Gregarina niphandrodes]|eukprot:XP_011133075.1 putative transmembrane protein [Gregarina niphandrodes]
MEGPLAGTGGKVRTIGTMATSNGGHTPVVQLSDTSAGDTPAGDTPAGDTSVGDTSLGDTSVGQVDRQAANQEAPGLAVGSAPVIKVASSTPKETLTGDPLVLYQVYSGSSPGFNLTETSGSSVVIPSWVGAVGSSTECAATKPNPVFTLHGGNPSWVTVAETESVPGYPLALLSLAQGNYALVQESFPVAAHSSSVTTNAWTTTSMSADTIGRLYNGTSILVGGSLGASNQHAFQYFVSDSKLWVYVSGDDAGTATKKDVHMAVLPVGTLALKLGVYLNVALVEHDGSKFAYDLEGASCGQMATFLSLAWTGATKPEEGLDCTVTAPAFSERIYVVAPEECAASTKLALAVFTFSNCDAVTKEQIIDLTSSQDAPLDPDPSHLGWVVPVIISLVLVGLLATGYLMFKRFRIQSAEADAAAAAANASGNRGSVPVYERPSSQLANVN